MPLNLYAHFSYCRDTFSFSDALRRLARALALHLTRIRYRLYCAGWLVYAAPFRVYGIDTLFTTDSLLAAQPGASC